MEDLLRRLGLDLTAFANRLRDWLREPKAARPPADGEVLTWDASDGTWGPEPVPASDSGVQIAQDLGGTEAAPVVIGLQTVGVDATAPNDGDVLTYDSGTGTWGPAPPPFDPSAPSWGMLYEVDFSAEPNQTLGAAGSYTIGGATWWAKGSLSASGWGTMTSNVVNGTGLVLATSGPTSPYFNLPGSYPLRVLFLPLSQFTGYNPAAPLVVQFRIGTSNAGSIRVGLIDAANSAAALTSAERATIFDCGPNTGGATTATSLYFSNVATSTIQSPTRVSAATINVVDMEYAAWRLVAKADLAAGGAGVPGFLDVENLTPGYDNTPAGVRPSARTNAGVLIMYSYSSIDTVSGDLVRLRVSQPKASS